jgi:hypothetical protein
MKEKFVSMRMPIDLYNLIKAQADANTRSMSSEIVHLIKQSIEVKIK